MTYISEFVSSFLSFMSMVRITDIIDIVIIAFLAFQVIRFMRETRAELLVKGIIVLLVLLQLSNWFKLNTVQYILKNIVQLGFFALLIVFQPEMRRGLERIGRSHAGQILSFNGDKSVVEASIEMICNAAKTLSDTRTGALICIERTTKLGDIINTGTAINSDISTELLLNIFVPNTPLHDGAVIISDNKIAAAACFLPLTSNNDLSKELGTRHRAAIGLSENSDAVVVVVSEETGKISIALDGGLTRNLTVETLKRALTKIMETESSSEEKTRFTFFKKVGSK